MDSNKSLQEEGNNLLYKQGLHALLFSHGEVLYAGSYVMDMLTWRDIDLNLIIDKDQQKQVCVKILGDLLDRDDVTRFKVIKNLREKYAR